MIKKLFILPFFVFSLFFIFNSDVSANVHTGISYDAHERFNVFYEIKNNTPMANFLLTKDKDALDSFLGENNLNHVSIFYASELEPYLLDGYSFPTGTKYIFIYTGSEVLPQLQRDGNKYFDTSGYVRYSMSHYKIAFFNDDAEKLDSNFYDGLYRYFSSDIYDHLVYEFSNTSEESINQFSYFISHFWYYDSINMVGMFEDTYVTDVIYNGEKLLIDDSEVNQNIFTSLKDFWLGLTNSESLIDPSKLNLTYFQKFNYMTDIEKPKSTYEILNYSNTITPPDGFLPLNFEKDGRYVDGYLFIPKSVNTLMNRDLYGYTTSLPLASFSNDSNLTVKQAVSGLKLNSENKLSALGEKNADFLVNYKKNYTLYNFNYKEKLLELYPDFSSSSTAIWVSKAIKYDSVVYYNPKAFSVCPLYTTGSKVDEETGANVSTFASCSFINPVNNEEVTLSGDSFYNAISSTNTIGASANIFDSAENQQALADKYSELYDYDEDGNIKGFNISSVLNNLKTFLKSFVDVIATIFESFTMFFNSLPIELRGFFYFSLVGGALLLFWKLIK